jgi:hypothetical protein
LQELDRLHQQHRDSLKEVEKLKMDVRIEWLAIDIFIFDVLWLTDSPVARMCDS